MNKLTFATTCANRESDLKRTLPINLEVISKFEGVNILILNYNSNGDLDEYIRTIDCSLVEYYKEIDSDSFKMSHAKNIASRLANSEYIINLDSDNILSTEYVQNVMSIISNDIDFISIKIDSDGVDRGLGGRIGCKKSVFEYLRGYDEALNGYGADDIDLENRAKSYGFSIDYAYIPNSKYASISQSDEEKESSYKEGDSISKMFSDNIKLITNPFREVNEKSFGLSNILSYDGIKIRLSENSVDRNIRLNKINISELDLSVEINNSDNRKPIFPVGNFFGGPLSNIIKSVDMCNPKEWAIDWNDYLSLSSQFRVIKTDNIMMAIAGTALGRRVILYADLDSGNKLIYEKYLKELGCRWADYYIHRNL